MYIPESSLGRGRCFLSSSMIMVAAFATAFYPRIITSIGAPDPLNFLHFILIPLLSGVIIFGKKISDHSRFSLVLGLLKGLLSLYLIAMFSALLNGAGAINVFLGTMIIAEPFILLAAIISISFTHKSLKRFKTYIIAFGASHIALALLQRAALETGLLKRTVMTVADNVQGVFYLSSGGHVVGASVSLAFGLYFYICAKKVPIILRATILFAVLAQILLADAKQVIFVALVSSALLAFSKAANLKNALRYLALVAFLGFALYWSIYNIEFFSPFQAWIRPHLYAPDGEATLLKLVPLEVIPKHYESPLNWLFGLGPGHTVGRIGGWMIRDYWSLFGPLGATMHPVSAEVWSAWQGHFLDSSFFSPLWGWAGIWGDFGSLGIICYVGLWGLAWIKVCKDDLSRFLVLNVIINGFIFTLMEEPGFVLTSVLLIAIRWHEYRLELHRQVSKDSAKIDTVSLGQA